jgi:hypothetical protein
MFIPASIELDDDRIAVAAVIVSRLMAPNICEIVGLVRALPIRTKGSRRTRRELFPLLAIRLRNGAEDTRHPVAPLSLPIQASVDTSSQTHIGGNAKPESRKETDLLAMCSRR